MGHLTRWRAALVATASSAVAYYEDRSRGKLIVLKIVKHLNLNGKKIGNRWSEMDESTEVTTITQMLLLILQTHSPCVFLSPFTEGSLSFFFPRLTILPFSVAVWRKLSLFYKTPIHKNSSACGKTFFERVCFGSRQIPQVACYHFHPDNMLNEHKQLNMNMNQIDMKILICWNSPWQNSETWSCRSRSRLPLCCPSCSAALWVGPGWRVVPMGDTPTYSNHDYLAFSYQVE